MNDIFYSQVETVLQEELDARARAGKTDRSTQALRFMTEKVANAELIAYADDFLLSDRKNVTILDSIGGQRVRGNEYLPVNYLNTVSRRIPPVITAASISISDASLGALNEATLNVLVSDIDQFESFEQVYLRPGRNVKLTIQHPESALLNGDNRISVKVPVASDKQSDTQPAGSQDTNATDTTKSDITYKSIQQKLNEVSFEGLITSFDVTYNIDTTISVTLKLRGRTSTFTDIHLTQYMQNDSVSTEDDLLNTAVFESGSSSLPSNQTLYSKIKADMASIRNAKQNIRERLKTEYSQGATTKNGQYKGTVNFRGSVIWGELFDDQGNSTEIREYVSLRYLTFNLNGLLQTKTGRFAAGPVALGLAETNSYEYLKSIDPTRVLLYQGTSNTPSSTYAGKQAMPKVNPITPGFIYNGKGDLDSIFISLKEIEQIQKKLTSGSQTVTIKDYYKEISALIRYATAGAINLTLVPVQDIISSKEDPTIVESILYLDANYTGNQINSVTPYSVPMFANDPRGTIVRNFNIKMALPKSAASLAYVLNSDAENISESSIAPFVAYMYADDAKKQQIETDYKKQHDNAISELDKSVNALANEITTDSIEKMIKSTKQYLKYPKADIRQANLMGRPIFDIEAEIDIDGINGFKFGDVIDFPGLPARYREQAVFIIYNVTHNIKPDGEWVTTLRTRLRTKI